MLLNISKYLGSKRNLQIFVYLCTSASVCLTLYISNCVCPEYQLIFVSLRTTAAVSVFFIRTTVCVLLFISNFCPFYISNCVCPSLYQQPYLSVCISANMFVFHSISKIVRPFIYQLMFCPSLYQQICVTSVYQQLCVFTFILATVCPSLYRQICLSFFISATGWVPLCINNCLYSSV